MLYRPALHGNWNALSLARRALKDKFRRQRFHSQLFCKIVRYFCRTLYNQVSDTYTFILTVPFIVRFWDPRMYYKCWYIGSVLQKTWWWLSTIETCCLKCNYILRLLCLTGICIVYEDISCPGTSPIPITHRSADGPVQGIKSNGD